jgi:hypothetical protein
MTDIVTLMIFGIPLAGLAWFAWTCTGPYQRRKKTASLEKLRLSKRYRGITIRNGNCKAVRRITGRFFTLEDVPDLPVEGCRALRCSCVYAGLNNRRYKDRREGVDPRSGIRFDIEHPERREQTDRRKSNRIKWQDPVD